MVVVPARPAGLVLLLSRFSSGIILCEALSLIRGSHSLPPFGVFKTFGEEGIGANERDFEQWWWWDTIGTGGG